MAGAAIIDSDQHSRYNVSEVAQKGLGRTSGKVFTRNHVTDLQDKPLVCRDCNQEFIWTAGEQRFFEEKGFTNPPSRCPDCRKKNKEERRSNRVTTKIICKECGKEGEVPFQPKDPNDILCSDCFYKMKQGEAPQADSAPKTDGDQPAPSGDDESAEN